MILVKAAPVLTRQLAETMCVAAIDLDEPRWIRLHPVPFRDLDDDKKFRKYQEVEVKAFRPASDRRPESWTPIEGSARLGEAIGTDHRWSDRRLRVAELGERTMCDLIALNRLGSGPDTPSLAVVRVAGQPGLLISQRDEAQVSEWRRRAEAMTARKSLFDDSGAVKAPFEVIPWRFRYRYRCLADGCKGHKQTIVDWEASALFRNVRRRPNWQDLMRQKFVDEMWAPTRDTVLFVGNMEQRPWNFLILGVFWPPSGGTQGSLFQ